MRERHVLQEGWLIRELDAGRPDVGRLTCDAFAPDESWTAATMPAQVHETLLAHGQISDPRVGRNAADSAWVGERDWAYACTFRSPPTKGDGPAYLRFRGLDTLATVCLNGIEVGQFQNMHRHHTVEVRSALRPAGEENVLLIVFASPLRAVAEAAAQFAEVAGIPPYHHVRKCRSDFTSYLGARPHSAKVGVFDDVILDVPNRAWLEDVWVRPTLSEDLSEARIAVAVETGGAAAEVQWRLVDGTGQEVAQGTTGVEGSMGGGTARGRFEIVLADPKLWWPRTHGVPHLYVLHVDLAPVADGDAGSASEPSDSRTVRFGVRRVEPVLADPQTGEARFAFRINGQQIYLRGACWAPLEGLTHCWSQERATRLLGMVEQGQMNVLRVWGGGSVPPEAFYEACDQRGILIWQDFMFGYGKYPSGEAAFDDEVRAEIEDVVQRLRNHPCLLLWCGGNENHMGWDFQFGTPTTEGWTLFEEVMPEVCARLDPGRFYHPSSPHGGRAPNWPLEGDWHDYTTLTFSPQASVPLFASEIGRASAPSVASMRRFLDEGELWPEGFDPRIRTPGQPAWPEMWQVRSVDGSWNKVGPIERFCDPASAEDLVRVLGTAHGEYLQQRIERHRRGVPDGAPDGVRRNWGTTIWRLNDTWPILYWSAIDYYLEPKIPYYFLRRAYAPVLVCFERTADRIAAWVVNDSPVPVSGTLRVRRMRFDGTVLGEVSGEIAALRPGGARRCVDTTDLGPIKLRDEFLWAGLNDIETTLLLTGERYLHLPAATLNAHAVEGRIEVSTDVYARQVTLEVPGATGAVFEDNFFDVTPRQTRIVSVIERAGGQQVRVSALNAAPVHVDL